MPQKFRTHNHSSKVAILAGFLSIISLLAALIYVAIFSISNNSESLLHITHEQDEVANIFSMRDAAYKRTLLLYKMNNVSDPFDRDELYLEFKAEAGNFIRSRNELLEHNSSLIKSKLWQHIQPLVNTGVQSQQRTVNFILSDQKKLANEELQHVLPNQEKVMAGLTQMLETQNSVINDELAATQIKNNNYHTAVLVLGLIAILLGIGIAYFVYRYSIRTELTLINQQKIADSANKAKSSFLANMSHEIRTPLTAIIGFTEQILNKNMGQNEQFKLKQTIVRNSKHLQNLINDILDLSKIESGQLEVEMTAVSPIHINYEIESIFSKRANDKNLTFTINNKFPLPSSIISDSVRVKQILLNLCSNAVKFTSEGEIKLETIYDSDKNLISFLVTDTGIGLTKDKSDKIFSPFTQADASTTRKYGGTGLGLSISSLLATELSGSLQCKSEIGKGSQFILTLPTGVSGKIKMITNEETYTPTPNNSLDNLDIKQLQGNILLAEDVKDNQELISMYIKQTGAQLDIVENGEDAINKALEKEYDLILMDMQMPKVDGIEAISTLRDKGYTKPIVSLTANAMSVDQDKCLNAGADQFLAKPININAFYSTLNSFLKEQTQTPVVPNNDAPPVLSRLERLTQTFITQLPAKISTINEAFLNKNWEQIEKTSHNLKGVGSSFGFSEITESSERLNDAIREKNYGIISDLMNNLTTICNDVVASKNKSK